MNAPLPDSVRRALETVTLDDKPHRGLQYKYEAGGIAACCGFGIQQARQGGVV